MIAQNGPAGKVVWAGTRRGPGVEAGQRHLHADAGARG